MKLDEFLNRIGFKINGWDDYGYKQTIEFYYDDLLKFYVKVEPHSQDNINRIIEGRIEKDNVKYFFWGGSPDYYEFIKEKLPDPREAEKWYELTGDIAFRIDDFLSEYTEAKEYCARANLENEITDSIELKYGEYQNFLGMIDSSFFRDQYNWEDLLNQCHRLTIGEDFLSNYKFTIESSNRNLLDVDVKPKDNISIKSGESEFPFIISNNVYCIIGKNGSGKTSFLQQLAFAFAGCESKFNIVNGVFDTVLDANVINKILYISFSPFDEKISFEESTIDTEYIGIQNYLGTESIDTLIDKELLDLIKNIRNHPDQARRRFWIEMLNRISFEDLSSKILEVYKDDFVEGMSKSNSNDGKKASSFVYANKKDSQKKLSKLSSGQKIFLLVLTSLALKITQRTVVLIDEPELFLHPPMIKAYIRLIADIVSAYNGLAFMATHSPITIQEIPNRCVKIATRDFEGSYILNNIEMNTFGESINTINDSIFNIGLQQTGYYKMIEILKSNQEVDKLERLVSIAGSEANLLIRI